MNHDTAIAGFVLVIAAIGMMLLIICVPTPAGAAVCLTYKDARHLWPTRHIWWYRDKQTGDRCWSNRRRGPPRGLKFDPVPNKNAQKANTHYRASVIGVDKRGVEIVDPKVLNELDALAPNSSGPIIMFPELTDKLDALTKWWQDRWK